MSQLLTQAPGEHEEAIRAAELDIRVTTPNDPIYASVVGQKWWSLLDELVLNATEYSLPGSRVCIALVEQAVALVMTMKNIIRYDSGTTLRNCWSASDGRCLKSNRRFGSRACHRPI